MQILSIKNKNKNKKGFLLVEVIVAIVLIGGVFGLLVFTINRTDNINNTKDTLGYSQAYPDSETNNHFKFIRVFKGDKNLPDILKQKTSQISIGKQICNIDEVQMNNSLLNKQNVSTYRITGVSTSTEITFIRKINDNIFIGLDSSSTTDPDIVGFQKITIANVYAQDQEVELSIDNRIYSLDSGPGVLSVIVAGKLLFVLLSGTTEHVKTFFVEGKRAGGGFSTPQLLWNYKLPLTGMVAKTFAFDAESKTVFIGFPRNAGAELFSIKINNSGAIETVTAIEVDATINYLYVSGNYIYVPNTLDPEIIIIDKLTKKVVGSYDATGTVGNGKRLDELGAGLIFGRTIHGNELSFVFDVTSTGTSTLNYFEKWGTQVKSSVDYILSFDGGFFSLSLKNAGQVDLYKYDDNNFKLIGTYILPFGRGNTMYCDDDYLYVGSKLEPVIYLFKLHQ